MQGEPLNNWHFRISSFPCRHHIRSAFAFFPPFSDSNHRLHQALSSMSSFISATHPFNTPIPCTYGYRRQSSVCQISDRPAFRSNTDRARDFLTQRAVQQTMFCSRVLRDETTVRWMEDWLDHHALDDLHHCDALRVTSQEYLTRLLREPPVVLQVKKPIPGRTTNKNPYLKRRYFTYDVEIVPRNIAMRILAARKQIAEELQTDIPRISNENQQLLNLYRSRFVSDDSRPLASYLLTITSVGDIPGSPYRTANFDLVKNYTLYLGLLSVIRELGIYAKTRQDAEWLKDFLERYGIQLIYPYAGERGVADRIIETLLMTPPSIRADSGTFLDPGTLTNEVLKKRVECAEEWLQVMLVAEQEDLELKRDLLEKDL